MNSLPTMWTFLLFCYVKLDFGRAVRESLWKQAKLNQGEYFIIDYIGDAWNSRSVSDCIIKCNKLVGGCQCFRFNEALAECLPGGYIMKSVDPDIPPPIHPLYVSDKTVICDESLGFSLYSQNDLTVCAFVSGEYVNYDTAVEKCAEKHGTLYTMKSKDKLFIARDHLRATDYLWIGLRDIYQNKSFYWADGDHLDRDTTLWADLWYPGQPAETGVQFCGVTDPGDSRLHDDLCTSSRRQYICERILN